MHKNDSIKSIYLEETKEILNELPVEMQEEICSMLFAKFKTKLKTIFTIRHL